MKRMVLALLLLWVFLLLSSSLQAQTPFYQGKTVRLVVGSSAGSTYDLYARLIGHHWGKHIPGKPEFVVQNMPGAGSLIAANHIYNAVKPDGLTLASINPALYFNQLAGKKEVQFDWAKFTYLGSPDRSDHLLHMRADSPFKTIHDVRRASEPPKCSATATGTTGHYFPRLLEETIGTKFAIVTGYQGGPEMDLALERNEVHCRALTLAAWFTGEIYRKWRDSKFARVLLQTGSKRDPRLPEVPLLAELMNEYQTPDSARRLASVILASGELGRPYVGPPGLSVEVTKILRESFAKMMNDAEFLADAKKRNIDIEPTPAKELERLSKEVIQQPPEVTDRVTKLLAK
ncbi:MAG: Bug family tripartite tricarboxylate transporter substrate binding protein [Candidatus Binatia bacterium]